MEASRHASSFFWLDAKLRGIPLSEQQGALSKERGGAVPQKKTTRVSDLPVFCGLPTSNIPFNWTRFLLPLSLEHKRCPIIRSTPSRVVPHSNLGSFQCLCWPLPVFQHAFVEAFHQFGGGGIVHTPQAHHHSRRTGVHKTPRQAYQPFSSHFLAQPRLAGTQYHQIRRQIQVVDVVQPQEPVR